MNCPRNNLINLNLKKKIEINSDQYNNQIEDEIILCNYCKRSLKNGKRCIGMCVSDSEY